MDAQAPKGYNLAVERDSWLPELARAGRWRELKARLSASGTAEAAAAWKDLRPIEKLAAFKLLESPRAMALYQSLEFGERYFLFLGFSYQAIAPVLESLDPGQRRLFLRMGARDYETMLAGLTA